MDIFDAFDCFTRSWWHNGIFFFKQEPHDIICEILLFPSTTNGFSCVFFSKRKELCIYRVQYFQFEPTQDKANRKHITPIANNDPPYISYTDDTDNKKFWNGNPFQIRSKITNTLAKKYQQHNLEDY